MAAIALLVRLSALQLAPLHPLQHCAFYLRVGLRLHKRTCQFYALFRDQPTFFCVSKCLRRLCPALPAGPSYLDPRHMSAVTVSSCGAVHLVTTSAKHLLLLNPGCPYTAVLVTSANQLVDWELHWQRLTLSWYLLYGKSLQVDPSCQSNASTSVLQLISQAVQRFRAVVKAEGELAIVVLLQQQEASSYHEVHVHCSAYRAPGPHVAIHALVAGRPRQQPEVKSSSWALQRQPLEQLQQAAGCSEVLLYRPPGSGSSSSPLLLEGLVTNFFVVCRKQLLLRTRGPACQGAGGPGQDDLDVQGLAVMTAAVQQGVLPGIMRARVLQACKQLQVDVLEQGPCLQDSACWVEAFVTNALRGVQPVGRLLLQFEQAEALACEAAGREVVLAQQYGTLTRALQQLLPELQKLTPLF